MSMRAVVVVSVLFMVVCVPSLVVADREKPAEKLQKEGPDNPPAVVSGPLVKQLDEPRQTDAPARDTKYGVLGTIQYDNGAVTAVPMVSSNCFGNQFNTHTGLPMPGPSPAGSLTKITFYMVSVAPPNAFVSVFGPVTTTGPGTAAPFILSQLATGVVAGAFNTHTFATPIAVSGASFLAGVWYFGSDVVGLGTGTTNGQGHHGMMINDIVGTGFATLPGLNALVRTSGTIVPVELMNFDVQ